MMEKIKALRKVIWIATVIFFMQLAIIVLILYPMTTFLILSLTVLAIIGLYLARISLALLRELEKKHTDDK